MKPIVPCLMMLVTVLAGISAPPAAFAQKDKKPGGGGGTSYAYTLTDLLGFPSQGYQSRAYFITNRDTADPDTGYPGGNVMVYGVSRIFIDGRSEFHPALWRIAADGTFPASDPLDSGLPPASRSVDVVAGFSGMGYGVVNTGSSAEQDEDGHYLFPSYIDTLGGGFLELADLDGGRNTSVSGANEFGEIIGAGSVGGLLWKIGPSGLPSAPESLGRFYPTDINNYGVIAGELDGYMAIAWVESGTLQFTVLDSNLRASGATVRAINDCARDDPRLTVVAESFRDEEGNYPSRRGLVWRPNNSSNELTVIGTFGGLRSAAHGVNCAGEVVGWANDAKGNWRAFRYFGGSLVDLNTQVDLGSQTLNYATDINDDGDIVGWMRYPRPISEQRAYLLRPIP